MFQKPKLNEVLVPAICAVLGLAAAFSLYGDLTGRTGSGSGIAVGDISYRYRVAQRRYASRVVWEDVEQKENVYNQDSIRTDDRSEATVTLGDGTKIELDPQSMIVLHISDKENSVEVAQGSVLVRDPGKVQLLSRIEGVLRAIKPEGELRMSLRPEGVELRGDFSKDSTSQKKAHILFRENGMKDLKSGFQLLSPADNTREFVDATGQEISFAWNGPEGAHTFEISEDRSFSSLTHTESIREKARATLAEGIYYWRVKSGQDTSPVYKFRIVHRIPVRTLSPGDGEIIKLVEVAPLVALRWTESKLALQYHVRISGNRDLKNPIVEKDLFRNGLSLSLPAGTYYWRIDAAGALPGSDSISPIATFSVEDARQNAPVRKPDKSETTELAPNSATKDVALAQPLPLSPWNGQQVDMATTEVLTFAWKPVPGAERYTLVLRRGPGGPEAFRTETNSPFF